MDLGVPWRFQNFQTHPYFTATQKIERVQYTAVWPLKGILVAIRAQKHLKSLNGIDRTKRKRFNTLFKIVGWWKHLRKMDDGQCLHLRWWFSLLFTPIFRRHVSPTGRLGRSMWSGSCKPQGWGSSRRDSKEAPKLDRIERNGELIRISLEISSLLDFRRPQHQEKGRISAWDVTTANGYQQRLSSLAFQGPRTGLGRLSKHFGSAIPGHNAPSDAPCLSGWCGVSCGRRTAVLNWSGFLYIRNYIIPSLNIV